MPITIKFDPTANSTQAAVIPNASSKNDGVMSKVMATKLDLLGPTIWDTLIPPSDIITTDANPVVVSEFTVDQDGIIALITNVVAANLDGTLWAGWLVAESVYTRINGLFTLQAPIGPLTPAFDSGGAASTWTIEFTVNGGGTALQISVKGSMGVNVKWSVHAAGNQNTLP